MNREIIYTMEKKYNEQGSGIYFGEKNTMNRPMIHTLEKKLNEQGNDIYYGEKIQ